MSEKPKHPKDYKAKAGNPANHAPTAANWWFVPSPYADKYLARGGNAIKLLNCGEEYLPELLTAIKNAKNSIYIINWGFEDELSLILLNSGEKAKPENYISKILEDKAAGKNGEKPVEVKVLVWHSYAVNTFNESTLKPSPFANSLIDAGNNWWDKAKAGKFKNLQFLTRSDPHKSGITTNGQIEKDKLIKENQQIDEELISHSVTDEGEKRLKSRRENIKSQIKLLDDGWDNVEAVQDQRSKKGWTIADMGSFPTHHQKVILIDHNDPDNANGFVQGFNFWTRYFDYSDHRWRDGEVHFQDVGLHLWGPCLLDLFHNFMEGWNKEVTEQKSEKTTLITEVPKKINDANPNKGNRYYAQILRTWPLKFISINSIILTDNHT